MLIPAISNGAAFSAWNTDLVSTENPTTTNFIIDSDKTVGVTVVAGVACTNVLFDSTSETFSGDHDIRDDASYYYIGQTYNETTSYNICQVSFAINAKTGDISVYDYVVQLWTRTGNDIVTKIGESTPITGNNTWLRPSIVDFTFATPVTLTANTDYSIVVGVYDTGTTNEASIDAVNYAELDYTNTNAVNGETDGYLSTGVSNNIRGNDRMMKVMYQ